jgi:hypothetical protein
MPRIFRLQVHIPKAFSCAVDNSFMNKRQARALLESASGAAEAIVTAQLGHFDITDPECGAAYDRVLFPLLAELARDMTIADFLDLLS